MANPFSNIVKFLKAVNLLASPKGTTLKELGDCLGISRRSVFRLLNALGELDFPLDDNLRNPSPERRTAFWKHTS